MLLSIVLGTTASASAVLFAHVASFAVTALLIVVNTVMLCRSPLFQRHHQYGPLYLCLFSSPLLMCNPIVNVLEDEDKVSGTLALHSVVYFFTWVGVLQMTIATSWNSGLHKRIYRYCCGVGTPPDTCDAMAES